MFGLGRCQSGDEEEDEDILVEERPQIELVTVFHRDTCHREVHQRTFVTSGSRVKRVLPWALTKWTKHVVTFNQEEDEDILVEEGSQIERGTVSPRDTCLRETHPKSIRDKRIPREAFFDLGDVKVENVIVTFHDLEKEDILVEEGSQIERGTMFHRDTSHREFHPRNIRDKWLPREACFDLGDVKVEKDIVAFNADEDEDILVEDGPQI